jgi:hypothetical protein
MMRLALFLKEGFGDPNVYPPNPELSSAVD